MQQKSESRSRNRFALIAGAVLLIIALLIAYLALFDDNDDEKNATTPAPSAHQQYPVTIIIIDDFSKPMTSLIDRVAPSDSKTGEDFTKAAQQIQTLTGERANGYGPDVRKQIMTLVEPLKSELADRVMSAPEMNLNGRSPDETTCAVTPEGTAAFVTEGTAAFVTEGTAAFVTEGTGAFVTEGTAAFVTEGTSLWDQPHGQRIQMEFEEMLKLPQAQGLDIRLQVLDAQGFVFPDIAQKLNEMITDIRSQDPNMRIVVNMSFAIVPCEKVTDIVAYTRLLREFAGVDGDPTAFAQVLGALYTEDIFHTTLTGTFQSEFCPQGDSSVICTEYAADQEKTAEHTIYFVGASGNGLLDENGTRIGLDFPFYPAAWPQVIAISANNGAKHLEEASVPRAAYSNAGRIIMGGTWPPDAASWTPQSTLDKYPQAGTSFAAPRYSFIVALYLANAEGIDVGCGTDKLPPPADAVDWLAAPPPAAKTDQGHCSTLVP